MPNNPKTGGYRLLLIGSVLLPFVFAGCAPVSTVEAPPEVVDTGNLVWPDPPDPARISYVTSLSSQKLLNGGAKTKKSGPSLKDILLGESKKGEDNEGAAISKPLGVTADKEGRVFVTDTELDRLLVFDLKKKTVSVWGGQGKGRLRKPIGVTSDSTGKVYVTDTMDKRVVIYDRTGKFLYAWSAGGAFERPTGIAIDEKRGRVYVIDTLQHHIAILDMRGTLLTTIGKRGQDPGQFNYPSNLTVGPKGRLFVVDTLNHRVQIMKPDGTVIKTFGRNGDSPGEFARPKGIALDSDGNIYVADAAFNNIQIFNQKGDILLYVGVAGVHPGEFQLPAGVFMANDRLYVADQLNARIQVFQYLKVPPGQEEKKPSS